MPTPKPLKVTSTWYVIDADIGVIVEAVAGPVDKPWITTKKAEDAAFKYAKQTGHSVVVARPYSYH